MTKTEFVNRAKVGDHILTSDSRFGVVRWVPADSECVTVLSCGEITEFLISDIDLVLRPKFGQSI